MFYWNFLKSSYHGSLYMWMIQFDRPTNAHLSRPRNGDINHPPPSPIDACRSIGRWKLILAQYAPLQIHALCVWQDLQSVSAEWQGVSRDDVNLIARKLYPRASNTCITKCITARYHYHLCRCATEDQPRCHTFTDQFKSSYLGMLLLAGRCTRSRLTHTAPPARVCLLDAST
jgi:hypothetical protein